MNDTDKAVQIKTCSFRYIPNGIDHDSLTRLLLNAAIGRQILNNNFVIGYAAITVPGNAPARLFKTAHKLSAHPDDHFAITGHGNRCRSL